MPRAWNSKITLEQKNMNENSRGMRVYMLRDTLKKHLSEHESVLSFLVKMPEFIKANELPGDMILFTAEFFYRPEKICEIVLSIADDPLHLGRKEKHENCIFSRYADSPGKTIVLNNVKTHPAFLELDPRINAEIFCECEISADLVLILNMECSSDLVSEEASLWFSRIKEKIFPPFE
jgi:hypothetical protein